MDTQDQFTPLSGSNQPNIPPENYMVWAILSTILCCLPFGIVSIVKASEVNKKWLMQDYDGAMKSSKSAKTWAIWSAIAAVAVWVIYILIFVVIGVAGGLFSHY